MVERLCSIRLALYGLIHERHGAVRADVFAATLTSLVRGLRASDRHVNGAKCLDYHIINLELGSAKANICESEYSTQKIPERSSVRYFRSIVFGIKDGDSTPKEAPAGVLQAIVDISKHADQRFSHGELIFEDDPSDVVLIDKFLEERASRALAKQRSKGLLLYSGVSYSTFDGILKEVDLRGIIHRAKLVLSIGDQEIDCTCNSVTVDNLRENLDRRVSVSALAYYNEVDHLPERIDIKKIEAFEETNRIEHWKGAFDIPSTTNGSVW